MYVSKQESIAIPFFNNIISQEWYHFPLKFPYFANNAAFNENKEAGRQFKMGHFCDSGITEIYKYLHVIKKYYCE
jgi:hypothetical protein